MQPDNLGRTCRKPESQMTIKEKVIEVALKHFEDYDTTLNPVSKIQVNVSTTTTFIINCAQVIITQVTNGSTWDILMIRYIELKKLHNYEYLQCMTNPVLWERHEDDLDK